MKLGIVVSGLIGAFVLVFAVLLVTPAGTGMFTALFPVGPVATVDFAAIDEGRNGHRSLMCPTAAMCPARDDGTAIYDADLARTKAVWAAAAKAERGMGLVYSDDAINQYTYVVRSGMWRMPDLITVQFVDQSDKRALMGRDDSRTTVLVYSRSLFRAIDLDGNSQRVRRLLAYLDSHLSTYKR